MPDNSRLNPLQEQSTIEKLRDSYFPPMPPMSFSAKNTTTVQLNGEVEKSQETFKAELNNISSLIQTLEKNPQDLELRAQISTRLTNAVSTAAASIPLPDCERMMQNYGIRTYWEDMKAGKTILTDQNKDLNQAQLHQEQQAVLTAQQIAQIKQQAINDYNKTWKDHNNFDYAHASVADREKWMQDELKKMPQWAQELGQIARTKPFNEAKIEIQEQLRQKLKDIEEKKKEMLAVKNDPHATEEEKRRADLHLQFYQQEEKNIRVCQQGVDNAKTSKDLGTASKQLENQSKELVNIANYGLANQSQEETSEKNRIVTVADDIERKQAKSTTAYLNEADNNRVNGKNVNATAQSLAYQSQEETSEKNKTLHIADNRERTKGKQLSAALNTLVRDESRTTLSSDTTAAQELRNAAEALKTSNATSRPDAQNMDTLLSALNLDTSQEGKNENIVMSSTAEKENTPNTSDKPKETSLAAVLKDMNTPPAPEVEKTASAEPVVQAPTLPNESKGASAKQTAQNTTPQNTESASHTLSEPNAVKAPNTPDLSALLAASSGKLGTGNQVLPPMEQNTM